VFRIRKLFKEINSNKVTLTIAKDDWSKILPMLVNAIYDSYVKMKLNGLPSSLTTVVRSSNFYDFGAETYNVLKKTYNWEETDFITKNMQTIT
jgi:hypothetical protein